MSILSDLLPLIVVLAVCLFGITRGGVPERVTGLALLATLPLGFLVRAAPEDLVPTLSLMADGAFAFLFLFLTLRYASWWLGFVLLLYAAQFGLHAFYLVANREPDRLHALTNNVVFIAVTISLLIGTVATVRRRAVA